MIVLPAWASVWAPFYSLLLLLCGFLLFCVCLVEACLAAPHACRAARQLCILVSSVSCECTAQGAEGRRGCYSIHWSVVVLLVYMFCLDCHIIYVVGD